MDLTPFWITFKLAVLTTLILVVIGVPLAYYLAYSRRKVNVLLESLLMLPIVLPPTVLGYYFIVFLGPNSAVGHFFEETLGIPLVFSFEGILIGSLIYCFPFMLSPLVSGFRSLPPSLYDATRVFGKSRWNALWHVMLPNIKTSLITALLLTFAHTIGEFGMVLMIGGNLPETKVASVAIYDELNRMNYDSANGYALVLLGVSLIMILVINLVGRKTFLR